MVSRSTLAALESLRADLRELVSADSDHADLRRTVAAMRATVPIDDSPATFDPSLPRAWRPQRFHAAQSAAFRSTARHRAIEAGRRSGKSEGRKREIVIRALDPDWPLPVRYIVVGAPTQQQSMRLYWRDLLALMPKRFVRAVRKTDYEIETVTGALIRVSGMDKPQRVEGDPIDDLFLDEFADMRLGNAVLEDHLGPSLSTPDRPPGRLTVYGTPDMRSGAHFVDLCDKWSANAATGEGSYGYWHWSSQGLVSQAEWDEAKATRDPASFAVEYEARRVSTGNRAYYCFEREVHVARGLRIIPTRPVVCCFDFNADPGTATLLQEQTREDYPGRGDLPASFTAVLAEVFIRNTNTPSVVRSVLAILERVGHKATVFVEGDPAGGAAGSAKVEGSDVDLIRRVMSPVLGGRLSMRFMQAAPRVVARLNAVNARLKSADGQVRMLVAAECTNTIRDFEQVHLKEGAAHVEIEKAGSGAKALLSHLCFDGSTLVETDRGIVAMRDLPREGLVRGPFGEFVQYVDAGLTIPDAPMVRLDVAGSGMITCNPWHLMLTMEAGWVRADQTEGLTLASSIDLTDSRSSAGSRMRGVAASSSAGTTAGFIGWSGNTSTGRSLRVAAGTFTTRTATGGTTRSRTSSCSPRAITCAGTVRSGRRSDSRDSARSSTSIATKPQRGTRAQRAGRGTANTRRASLRIDATRRRADVAGRLSAPHSTKLSTALEPVSPRCAADRESTTRIARVGDATRSSGSASICGSSSALGLVLSVTEQSRADAYCLRAPEHGCFALAGGWVVSNSDGAGYYLARQFPVATRSGSADVDFG